MEGSDDDEEIAGIVNQTSRGGVAATPLPPVGFGRVEFPPEAPLDMLRAQREAAVAERCCPRPSSSGHRPADPVARSLLSALEAEQAWEPIDDLKSGHAGSKRKTPPLGAARSHKRGAIADWPPMHPAPVSRYPLSAAFGSLGINPPRPAQIAPARPCSPNPGSAPPSFFGEPR